MSGKWHYDSILHLYTAISRGDLENTARWSMQGYNPAVTAAFEPVWYHAGAYTYPAAGGVGMAVNSNNVQDAAAGNNARTVEIGYLDANYDEQTEIVSLVGGGSQNTTATDILRVNSFHVKTVGTPWVGAAADIELRDAGGAGNFYAEIEAGNTVAAQAIYTVPADKVLFVVAGDFGVGNTTNKVFAEALLRSNYCCHCGILHDFFLNYIKCSVVDGCIPLEIGLPVHFPQKSEIRVESRRVTAGGVTQDTVNLHGWLYG
jgi:hypothetical protein